jgi:hypothetical protein
LCLKEEKGNGELFEILLVESSMRDEIYQKLEEDCTYEEAYNQYVELEKT